ncbi:MarR family transcriptional regulator [Priestia megaterium]|uniref:MarR family winged helix-turn-helix transcriptional regulator n=1 Tax=Priestia megaterium TaxID=1404 RepID=UPI0031FC9C84
MSFQNVRMFGYLLQTASNDFFNRVHKSLQPFHITPIQLGILQRLWQEDGITQRELARFLLKDQTNLGKMIDKLEEVGYIVREKHPTDRRAHLIYLTEQGRKIEKELATILTELNHNLLNGLTDDELAIFHKALETIISNSHK